MVSDTKVQITKPEDYPDMRNNSNVRTLKYVRKNEREQTLSNSALTCGQELVVCCTYRSLVCQAYIQIHPFVAGRSSYEPPDDSSENTACDRRMRNAQTHHLYFPVTIKSDSFPVTFYRKAPCHTHIFIPLQGWDSFIRRIFIVLFFKK